MHLKTKLKTGPLSAQWKIIGIHSHKGINIPLSALHSYESGGIGEFFDLIPLIDWCSHLNIDTLQLLPLNDSGFDPSPYNAISSCALHPIYLSLHQLPRIELHQELLKEIHYLRRFNLSETIPFQKVLTEKTNILLNYFKKEGNELLSSVEFSTFLSENIWIKPYALFKVLKEKSDQKHFTLWPDEWKNISRETFDSLFEYFLKECSFHIALQYLCFLQLTTVKKRAKEKNIYLKGDIPILISADSVDVWFHKELFDLQISIGVPPDQYNKDGQRWGFPLPNWDAMRKTGFSWWKNRLQYARNFYDLYRIDHAVGLFRLWTIPLGRPSSEGQYSPLEEHLWEPLGRELLQTFIQTSSMLPIAEDLGAVPPFVRRILDEMGICGTKVMRWEKNEQGNFINPQTYPAISLTCVSTHDSTTLAEWWVEEAEEAKIYALQKGWAYTPILSKEQRYSILEDSLLSHSLFHINLFSEYLALIPDLVWSDPKKERINIPGTILPSNWNYKFRRSLEEISSHPLLEKEMCELFKKSIKTI